MASVLGIDPGAEGGLAIVNSDRKVLVAAEMPMIEERVGKGKKVRRTDMPTLRGLLEVWIELFDIDLVMIEKTWSMQAGGGALMEHTGIVRGMLAMLPIRVERIEPSIWKLAPSIRAPQDKGLSTARAEQIFPDHAGRFRGKRGGRKDGLAEAAMMALYGHIVVLGSMR